LIKVLNHSIKPQEESPENKDISIGLLDIFGFENFKENSFE